jgi:hypothetical protein
MDLCKSNVAWYGWKTTTTMMTIVTLNLLDPRVQSYPKIQSDLLESLADSSRWKTMMKTKMSSPAVLAAMTRPL